MSINKAGLAHFWTHIVARLNTKVEAEDGKGLSTNDYTTEEKNKLAGIAEGATKITIDTSLSASSTNPVQNSAVHSAISNLNSLVGDTAVSEQISTAVTEAKTYTDEVGSGLQTQINTITNNPDTEGVINSINEFTQYISDHGEIAEGFRSDIDSKVSQEVFDATIGDMSEFQDNDTGEQLSVAEVFSGYGERLNAVTSFIGGIGEEGELVEYGNLSDYIDSVKREIQDVTGSMKVFIDDEELTHDEAIDNINDRVSELEAKDEADNERFDAIELNINELSGLQTQISDLNTLVGDTAVSEQISNAIDVATADDFGIYVQDTEPANAADGDIWVDTANDPAFIVPTIPEVTEADNGKVLMVVNGTYQLVSLNLSIDANGVLSM